MSKEKYLGINDLIEKYHSVKKEAVEGRVKKVDSELEVRVFLDALAELIIEAEKGLQIIDFMTFEKVIKAQRKARNPRTKEEYTIPKRLGVRVKLGKLLRETVEETFKNK